MIQRILIGHRTLEIIRSLLATVGDLPGLFVVIAGDGRGRPKMSVAGNFSAVVKVIEHAELQGEFVLVGCEVGAIHRQRRVTVTRLQITKNLIVSAILFDDVNHVLNRILPSGKLNRSGIVMQQIIVLNRPRKLIEFAQRGRNIQPCDRPPQQRRNIRMVVMFHLPPSFSHTLVRSRALALGGRNEQIVARNARPTSVTATASASYWNFLVIRNRMLATNATVAQVKAVIAIGTWKKMILKITP